MGSSAASHDRSLRSLGIIMVGAEILESLTDALLCLAAEELTVPSRQNRLASETVVIRYGIAIFRRQ